jgi:tetratricopeptide (TPR) repeat protein
MTLPKGSVVRDCGPEVLSAVFRFHGRKISVDEISNHIYNPQLKATLVSKILIYCQDVGFRATPKKGSIAEIRSTIQENRPVIAMIRINANLAHFLVIGGYNDVEKSVVIVDYDNYVYRTHYKDLMQLWEPADCFMLDLQPIEDAYERAERHEIGRRFNDAIAEYRLAIEKDPQNYRAWVGIGNCHAQLGQIKEARDAYQKALTINADDPQALNNLADCLIVLQERKEEAASFAEKSVGCYEKIIENLRAYLSECRDEMDRLDAQAQLEQTLKRLAFSYGTLGQALYATGRFDSSIDALKRSLELMPPIYKNTQIKRLREIADCYRKLNDRQRAEEFDKKAEALKSGS